MYILISKGITQLMNVFIFQTCVVFFVVMAFIKKKNKCNWLYNHNLLNFTFVKLTKFLNFKVVKV